MSSDPHSMMTISFGRSTSSNFDKAVTLARKFDSFRSEGEGRTERYSVSVPMSPTESDTVLDLVKLLDLISSWKSSNLVVDERPIDRIWGMKDNLAQVWRCYKIRKKVPIGEQYCTGMSAPNDERTRFGCRLERGVLLHYDGYGREVTAGWYQFGSLSKDLATFTVDKSAAMETLRANTESSACVMCPMFSWDRVEQGISELPDTVDLETSDDFIVKYSDINPRKALGIQRPPRREEVWVEFGLGDGLTEDVPRRSVPDVHYSDIAAQDDALAEIDNIVGLPLRHPDYFAEVGVSPHSGVILYGPPGNGKTLIAKAVACEAGAHLETINGPEVLSKWHGESEARLRRVFDNAKRMAPSVVLIDEIDSFASTRDMMTQQHDVSITSQLLVILDGLAKRGQVAVVATTNRIEAIDAALRRPGRFDYHVLVPLPDTMGRAAILKVHLAGMKLVGTLRIPELAEATSDFSGADLAAVTREAGLIAIRRGLSEGLKASDVAVTMGDMTAAIVAISRKRFEHKGRREIQG